MLEKIKTIVDFIKNHLEEAPEIGIIPETGLVGPVNEIEVKQTIP